MFNRHDRRFTDNIPGCITFISTQTVFKLTKDTKYEPDPAIEGVWRVTGLAVNKRHKVRYSIILYMAGYNDPWGHERKTNDFEEVIA